MSDCYRIVVCSDSHGDFFGLQRILQAQPRADLYIHLGDGERELEDICACYPDRRILFVAGNCDLGSSAPRYDTCGIGGKRIFYTHGHLFGVKGGIGGAVAAAEREGADILLFGHTHQPFCSNDGNLLILNPGSLSGGSKGYRCGIIDIRDGQISAWNAEVSYGG